MASYRFVVAGRVQGVFFRQSTLQQARALGVSGWVRNRADGSVEGLASGVPAVLEQFRAWLGHGPPAARVDSVEWVAADETADGGFAVR